jgi:hydrogenase-4 component B
VQPLTSFFAALLRTRRRLAPPRGFFPARASLATRTPDIFTEYLFRPAFKFVEWSLSKLRRLQGGSVHLYILYIAVTLIVLLIWKLR